MDNTENRIIKIIAEHLGIEEEVIKPERSLTELGADSLAKVEMLMALEYTFNIKIDDDEIWAKETLIQIVELVKNKLMMK